jgi:hypothetical protein
VASAACIVIAAAPRNAVAIKRTCPVLLIIVSSLLLDFQNRAKQLV